MDVLMTLMGHIGAFLGIGHVGVGQVSVDGSVLVLAVVAVRSGFLVVIGGRAKVFSGLAMMH